MKTWIAVVNRCEARLFAVNEKTSAKEHEKLLLVKKLENPKGRVKNGEVEESRPGSSKEHVAEMFAKEISSELERGYHARLFDDLVLVVEPHFLGKVRAALSKNTFKTISDTLHKDLAHVADHDLASFIWQKKSISETTTEAAVPNI